MTFNPVIKITAVLGIMLLVLVGCDSGIDNSAWAQIKTLGQDKTDLKIRVEQLEKENSDLKERLEVMSTIDKDKRTDALSGISRIEISKRTGLFDKDKNGTNETLAVYIVPVDNTGDVIKAPGSVNVQLWNLDKKENALLAQWDEDNEKLKTSWADTFMTNYYRLTYDISELKKDFDRELTVKVAFTDYVTGRVFRQQAVINTP